MDALSIAQSGMQAAQLRLDAAANNVANAQTEGFRRDEVRQQAQASGGVMAQVDKRPAPGADLPRDLVEQKMATYGFQANLQVVRAADQTLGRLLDTRA
ncbi:flagellar basal body protein [Tepidicella xavieri]|uniref:Flagellar basal-body rod protein FlgC n=1 Tax=Tepidicella xavieri TaxID=360241 RepID=A0A4R6U7K1_9BURK|nr:flagellar basal body protein [Tepidicella xavieri]TDQ42520.1 flagellar basal-body rod protein FlgC [Tepidicella xavieri]